MKLLAEEAELNMTKLVNNGEVVILDNESMFNEPLSKNWFAVNQSKNRWLNFEKKNHEKYLQYKGNLAKIRDKDESILSPICISETDKNDNVTSDSSEDCLWPKCTICIAGDSVISGLQQSLLYQKR